MTGMRVALAGFGTVGQELARRLCAGAIPAMHLAAISARDLDRARANSRALRPPPLVVPVAELPDHAEVIVECATGDALPEIARAALGAGRILVPVSVGGLAAHPEVLELAAEHGGRIWVATGTLPGLDSPCRRRGRDPEPAPDLAHPTRLPRCARTTSASAASTSPARSAAPVEVFAGSARQAALAFPKHFNVAVTLSLAGIGLDRTEVVVLADPAVPGAVHNVEVDAEDIQLRLTSRNRPSATNPRTSRAVAPSIMAALRALVGPVQVGS